MAGNRMTVRRSPAGGSRLENVIARLNEVIPYGIHVLWVTAIVLMLVSKRARRAGRNLDRINDLYFGRKR